MKHLRIFHFLSVYLRYLFYTEVLPVFSDAGYSLPSQGGFGPFRAHRSSRLSCGVVLGPSRAPPVPAILSSSAPPIIVEDDPDVQTLAVPFRLTNTEYGSFFD